MHKKLRKNLVVASTALLSLQTLVFPVGQVVAQTSEDTRETTEQSVLPEMDTYFHKAEIEPPRVFFSRSRLEGTVGTPIKVTMLSDQEISELQVTLPEEAEILTDQLPVGLSIQPGEQPQEWQINTVRPQQTFVLPVLFEDTGTYEVAVQDTIATLDVQEQEAQIEDEVEETEEASDQEKEEHSHEEEAPEGADETINGPINEEETSLPPDTEGPSTIEEVQDQVDPAPFVFDGELAEVSTMAEFLAAVADPTIGIISVQADLAQTSAAVMTVDRPLLIQGNGHTLNFGVNGLYFQLEDVAEATTFRIENAVITKVGTTPLINASTSSSPNWTLEVEDVTEVNANTMRLASIPEGTVTFTGGTTNFTRTTSAQTLLEAKEIKIINQAQVTISRGNASIFFSGAAVASPKLLVENGAALTISTTAGAANTIDLRGDDSSVMVQGGSQVAINTVGPSSTTTPTNTTNNTISLTGNAPKLQISEESVFQVRSTLSKRGIHLAGDQAQMSVNNAEIEVASATQAAVNLAGENPILSVSSSTSRFTTTTGVTVGLTGARPRVTFDGGKAELTSTTGQRLNLIGDTPRIELAQTQLSMAATTGRGFFLQGTTPQVQLNGSVVEMTDTGASQGMILQGEDALLSLRNESTFRVTGGGTGTIENIQIGSNQARPELFVTQGSRLSVTTTSGTGAATDTTNNAIHLRGAQAKATVSEGSDVNVSVTSNARRGLYVNGAEANVNVSNSQLSVNTLTGQAINVSGVTPELSLNQSEFNIQTTTGVGLTAAGENALVQITETEGSIQSTTGQRMNLIGLTPTLAMKQSQLTVAATTGRGIFLQGNTPEVSLEESELIMEDTGASQGMILQGTDALLSLANQSTFSITGGGTGSVENIQIGNNNARPALQVTDRSKVSITTTSGTTAASNTANNAIHLRGSEPKATVTEKSELAVTVESGARRALNLNGAGADLSVSDSKLTTETLAGQGLSIGGNDIGLTLTDASEVVMNSTTGNSILMSGNNASLLVEKASRLHTTTGAADSIRLIGNAPTLKVVDEGTVVKATSRYTSNIDGTATINIGSGANETRIENYLVEVGNHAKMMVQANVSSGLLMQGNNGRFDVYNQADVQLLSGSYNTISDGASNASLRFMRSGTAANAGGNTFTLDNARMTIEKGGGNASAVRMFGSNNHIHVLNRGEFVVKNPGNGSGLNGGTSGRNQGIHYTGSPSNNNSFTVRDPGSRVDIQADFGPAIDMEGTGVIHATNAGFFQASGRTSTAAGGIFNAGVLTVTFDDPLFMDFRNNRPGGGNLFNVSAGSTMTATNSDLAVWRNGVDLDGDPDLNFRNIGYSFSGANFNTLASTTDPDQLNTGVFGTSGLTSYSRMSSNNGRWAIADELRVPTNADKKIHGRISIPVGLDDSRPAWDDEAIVTVEVIPPTGQPKEYTAKTVGDSDESPGISIYGEEPRGGLFEINLDEPLEAGSIVQIKEVALTSGELTDGFSHQILTEPVEVFPIIPPTPAQFTSSTLAPTTTMIEGVTDNQDAEVTATHNGEVLDTSDVTIAQDGRFTLDLSGVTLEEDDEIQVFLRDAEGSASTAGVIHPPETNNARGNINPATPMTFRDATFAPATIFTIGASGPVAPVDPLDPETEVDPENKPELPEDQGLLSIDFASTFNFGSQAISAQEETYYAKPQRLLNEDGTVNEDEERPNYIQISDRRPENDRNGWQLAVTQNGQFETADEEPLLGARLSFTNQALATAQGGILPELQQTNPLTLVPDVKRVLIMAQGDEGAGTWIYRFGNQETAGQSIALTVPRGANPQAAHYRTTLTWELSAVPGNK